MINVKRIVVSLGFFVAFTSAQFIWAWSGYDYYNGTYIDIEEGNLVRTGETIELYDYGDGSYHDIDVESMERVGSSVELEGYDNETEEYRYFEMDDY